MNGKGFLMTSSTFSHPKPRWMHIARVLLKGEDTGIIIIIIVIIIVVIIAIIVISVIMTSSSMHIARVVLK